MNIRDIHQLRDAPPYGITALEGLSAAESALEEAVKFVPYCTDHLNVWSPQFAHIILECASQIDSLWNAAEKTNNLSSSKSKLNIKDHYSRYRGLVSAQKVVFFGGANPAVIEPFSVWSSSTCDSPPWWKAYNKLKHDRFSNQTEATLSHAIHSVAGLLLAIIYSGVCDLALISAKMLDTAQAGYNPWAFSKLLRDVPYECRNIIISRLFDHPLGVFGVKDCNLSNWWECHSTRFNIWWALNAEKFTVTPPRSVQKEE